MYFKGLVIIIMMVVVTGIMIIMEILTIMLFEGL